MLISNYQHTQKALDTLIKYMTFVNYLD